MDCSKNITPEHTGKAGRYILGIPSFGPNLLSGRVPENVVWSLTHSQHWDMVQGVAVPPARIRFFACSADCQGSYHRPGTLTKGGTAHPLARPAPLSASRRPQAISPKFKLVGAQLHLHGPPSGYLGRLLVL